jgi:TetR/AcrR family transcriptional repressor of mexJK operon
MHRMQLVESRRVPNIIDGHAGKRGLLAYMPPPANCLRLAVQERKLRLENVLLGAEQFVYPVLGSHRERALYRVAKRPSPSVRAPIAKQAVGIFLAGCRL